MTALKFACATAVIAFVGFLVWRFFRPQRVWVGSGHTYENFPLYLRRPTNVDTLANRKRYPRLVVVSHEFTHRYPDGRPEPEYNKALEDFDIAITSAFDSPARGVPILVETFGGFRHYYFCVTPDADVASTIQTIIEAYPAEKLTWEYRTTPGWDFLAGYATRYSTAISPPISFAP